MTHNASFYWEYVKETYLKKVYTKDDFKWMCIYVPCQCSMAGLANAYGNYVAEKGDYLWAFIRGFRNHLPMSILISSFYSKVVNEICKRTKHPRIYANSLGATMMLALYMWHCKAGTDNPFYAIIPGSVLGFTLTNVQVSKVTKSLEEELKE